MRSAARILLSYLSMALAAHTACAQNDTSIQRQNLFLANATYQSRLHFFGRTDSLQSSGFYPTIGFETKYGFYGNGTPIFVSNRYQKPTYSGSIIEAGYRFPESRNFSGNIFYNHFLYKQSSSLVQSALKAQTGANFTYNNNIVNVTLGGDIKFSDRKDMGATFSLDRLMIVVTPNQWAFAFNPTASLYAGTQNFTNTYFKDYYVADLPLGQQLVTEKVQRFDMLAYEISLPVVVVKGKFNGSVTPAYVCPQNLLVVPNSPQQSEYGKNMFYLSASVGVRL